MAKHWDLFLSVLVWSVWDEIKTFQDVLYFNQQAFLSILFASIDLSLLIRESVRFDEQN